MRIRLASLVLLFLTGPAFAMRFQNYRTVTVVFHCSVPAQVMRYSTAGRVALGPANELLTFPVPASGDVPVMFLLQRAGYADVNVSVSVSQLGTGEVPSDGVLDMTPLTPWVPVEDFFVIHRTGVIVVGGVGGFLLLGVVLPYYRRLTRRARLMRRLVHRDAAPDPNVGKHVGGYLLLQRLGSGGAATVYAAIALDDLEKNPQGTGLRKVALKVLHNSRMTVEFRERFTREVNICKSLNHPNLVRLLDWDLGAVNYLVMELVEGAALRRLIPPAGMEVHDAFGYLQGVFAGLAYAHSAGIVHCDMKPDNVMITHEGQVRVMDFGIATGQSYQRLTHTTDVLGTPGYMAPEQLDGVRNDPRSDQYALGAIVYEMLSGQQLFDETDPVRLITLHLMEQAKPLCVVQPSVPESVSEVVARMLSKRPDERYP
ncbi:MAG TPA: serine/threonine-protein kinase, partial [Candidatus Xenobia bacterium]